MDSNEIRDELLGVNHCPHIRFNGQEWILVGGDTHGAITTPERYRNFDESYAHLCRDGRVMRYGQQIGTREDVEFPDEVK